MPHRRARSTPHLGQKRGMGGLVGLDEAFAEDSTMSGSPDLTKQTSEEALLETAADTLGVVSKGGEGSVGRWGVVMP